VKATQSTNWVHVPVPKDKLTAFIPMTKSEMEARGWQQCDIIIVSGDAYVDHPSFGNAIIGRWLMDHGYKVGIISQPNLQSDQDLLALGKPRLFFGVTAGNMDSMVNHYTAQRKLRHNDAYSPDGVAGLRPDRASLQYTNKLKQLFKGIPIVLGGVEASLRRIVHYDYWSDTIKNSLLIDSKADILVYGMGERAIIEIADRIHNGQPIDGILGTVTACSKIDESVTLLPTAESCKDPKIFYEMSKQFNGMFQSHILYQQYGTRYIKHNPPAEPLSEVDLDRLYALPYQRLPHPIYAKTTIPAFIQIQNSITSHRGCFGGCNFCAIGYHQGKTIQSRSEASILREVEQIKEEKWFKNTISDIGGPSANMYQYNCGRNDGKQCLRTSCLYPTKCEHLTGSHQPQLRLLRKVQKLPKIKHVYIASGVRYDLALNEPEYIKDLASYYTGGHLKLAPEHVSTSVLQKMGKPPIKLYDDFCQKFTRESIKAGKNQHVIPYLIVGHPGTNLRDAIELMLYLHKNRIRPEQIQEFTPTPMSISTCMYFTEMDWQTGQHITVPKGRDVRLQKALAQWFLPVNRKLVEEALLSAQRIELLKVLFPFRKQEVNKR